ncbi:putative lipoprotein [Hydrogenimonas sp.]|nr:putative lipoprotein [Hydrogenimonas sp.]
MIRRFAFTLAVLFFAFLAAGCSGKNYFEPSKIDGSVNYDGELPAPIAEVGYRSATLENGDVITMNGVEKLALPKGYRYLARSGELVAAAGDCRPNIIYNTRTKKSVEIELPRRMVAAMFIPGSEKIAFLIEGNSYGIYNYGENRLEVKYESDTALTADIRVASPMMLENLVLIPTLDGKLVILSRQNGAKVREIIVGKGEEFNNVIFLDVMGDRLVAATPHRVISVSPKLMDALDMEISDLIFIKDGIYILSKEGRVYRCDNELKILNSRKFPFAHFVGAIYGEFLYLVEREGYVIATDPELTSANVFKIPDRIENWFFATKESFYYDRYYFKLHRE